MRYDPDGYTLGNPIAYEKALDEQGGLIYKRAGGAWFPTEEAARVAMGPGETLPKCWLPDGDPIPARVYALYFSLPDDTEDEVGAARLRDHAALRRLPADEDPHRHISIGTQCMLCEPPCMVCARCGEKIRPDDWDVSTCAGRGE